ncbi:hypothetical protein [Nakamurella deserti]|uniref:hypothetical protein n=1 Tax=Nakamurella deserti TaxID=2164074 RepID=UPI000DBE74D5|nr:hypothetical protein [Nakamurella deserti]
MNHPFDHTPRSTDVPPAVDTAAVAPARRRRLPVTALIGGVLGAGLLLTTTAAADDGATGTPTAPSVPAASAAAGPAPDGSAVTPPVDGAAPTPPVDGSAPTPPVDGTPPTPPVDGSAPTPPVDGSAPTPPVDGSAPTPPVTPPGGPGRVAPGGPTAGPAADGSTATVGVVVDSSDTGLTVRSDSGDSVSATFTDDTRFGPAGPKPADGDAAPVRTTAAELVPGSRVEIRVLGGEILSARIVVAHVDGTVTALSSTVATVTNREGLRIAVDLSGVTTTAAVGDQVRITGSVDAAGTTVVATSAAVLPTT